MARLKPLWSLVAAVVLGGLVAFVFMAFITPMLPGETLPGHRHEPPETRAYLLAVLRNDAAMINRLQLPQNAVQRAITRKTLEGALETKPDTLTFLGGSVVNQIGQYTYVLGGKNSDGSDVLVPVIVTTVGDKILGLAGGSDGSDTASPETGGEG